VIPPLLLMLYLNLNDSNRLCVEANELNTSGFYLWRVVNEQTKVEVVEYLTYTDISTRFVEFDVTLPTDLNITAAGDYTYYIYNGDNIDTDYNNFTILEVGKMRIDE